MHKNIIILGITKQSIRLGQSMPIRQQLLLLQRHLERLLLRDKLIQRPKLSFIYTQQNKLANTLSNPHQHHAARAERTRKHPIILNISLNPP